MNKYISTLMAGLLFSFSALAFAEHGGHGGWHHGHGHGYGHRHHYDYYGPVYYALVPPPQIVREQIVYYPQPVVQNPPPVDYYEERVVYQQAPVPVYQRAPAYYGDRRNPAGPVGGALGSVLGYEAGGGDPLAAGIGAVAGSLIGNGFR